MPRGEAEFECADRVRSKRKSLHRKLVRNGHAPLSGGVPLAGTRP